MKIRNFARIRSATPIMELVQDSLAKFFRPLEVNPYIDGVELDATIVAGTPVAISHGLGRTPVGWWVTDVAVATAVFRTAWSDSTITLDASVNCTIKVWVS